MPPHKPHKGKGGATSMKLFRKEEGYTLVELMVVALYLPMFQVITLVK